MAYAEAVRNLEDLGYSGMQGSQDGKLPAPELDSCQPTLRVRHYMRKLRTYLMVSPEMRRRYEAAATLIQRAWARCKERKKMFEMKLLVRSPRVFGHPSLFAGRHCGCQSLQRRLPAQLVCIVADCQHAARVGGQPAASRPCWWQALLCR